MPSREELSIWVNEARTATRQPTIELTRRMTDEREEFDREVERLIGWSVR